MITIIKVFTDQSEVSAVNAGGLVLWVPGHWPLLHQTWYSSFFSNSTGFMAILDAQDMTLISEVEAPIVTPIGVHNRWEYLDIVSSFLYNFEINQWGATIPCIISFFMWWREFDEYIETLWREVKFCEKLIYSIQLDPLT